jgi:hypothetical protein
VANKQRYQDWVVDALRSAGGSAPVVDVCKRVWAAHEDDLRGSGDLFYTWQYDIRWAAFQLRRRKIMKPVADSRRGIWELAAASG